MKKIHLLSFFLVAALLIGAVAVGMAPQAKAEDLPHGGHCVCGGNCDAATSANGHTHAAVSDWQPLTADVFKQNKTSETDSAGKTTSFYLFNAGNYYLTGDLTVSLDLASYIRSNETVSICLNGHKLTINNRAASVNGTLNICDCQGGGSIYDSRTGTSYGIAYLYSGGWLNLFGGKLYQAAPATTHNYGVVILGNNDQGKASAKGIAGGMNMYGGEIVGTKVANNGGAVTIFHAVSTMNLYGGTVTGGTATKDGGAISVAVGKLNVYGGKVVGGTSSATGGAIYVTTGKVNISGGTITGGSAPKYGNISVAGGTVTISGTALIEKGNATAGAGGNIGGTGTITMNGGTISGGTSTGGGGNVYMASATSTFNMNDGVIENGKVTAEAGGNVGVLSGTIFNMKGGIIRNGTASGTGGNFSVFQNSDTARHSQVIMTGGEILGGTAVTSGGSVRLGKNADFNMSGGTVDGTLPNPTDFNTTSTDTSKAQGGGLFYISNNSQLTVSGGEVKNGRTKLQGGIAYVNTGCSVTVSGTGKIMNGYSETSGGNIALNSGLTGPAYGTLNVNGGTVSGGKAKTSGGNVYCNFAARVNMTDGSIADGEAVGGSGGNIYCSSYHNINTNNSTVYDWDPVITVTGGTISGGTTANYGGNIYVGTATVTLSNATVSGGKSTNTTTNARNGGNLYICDAKNSSTNVITAADVTITECDILGGTANKGNGGNIFNAGGKLTITDSTIQGGTANLTSGSADGNGGNLYIGNGIGVAEVSVSGGSILAGTARAGGNMAIFSNGGDAENGVSFTNVTISDGTSVHGSGNIFIYNNGLATLTNCTVENGTAGNSGGNIGISKSGTVAANGNKTGLIMIGGKIGKGTTGKGYYGCGISFMQGTVDLRDGVVIDSEGDDIYMDTSVISNWKFQDLRVSGCTDTFVLYCITPGAFALESNVQKELFVPASTDHEISTYDGRVYVSNKNSVSIRDNKNAIVKSYHSFAEAMADYVGDGSQYLQMDYEILDVFNAGDKDLYVNLNGKNLRGQITLGTGHKFYGMDSGTDKYTTYAKGSEKYLYADVVGGEVAAHSKAANAKRYLATVANLNTYDGTVNYNRYSFDRFYVGITSVTMNPYSGEVGYKAAIGGNENIKNALADGENAFGFAVKLGDGDAVITGLTKNEFVTGSDGNKKNLTIQNQLEAVNEDPTLADVKVTANVFIKLANGETVTSADYSYSIVDMFKLVDNSFDSMDKNAQAAVKRLYAQYPVMENWGLTNIGA